MARQGRHRLQDEAAHGCFLDHTTAFQVTGKCSSTRSGSPQQCHRTHLAVGPHTAPTAAVPSCILRTGNGRVALEPAGGPRTGSRSSAVMTAPPVKAELPPLTRPCRRFGVAEDGSCNAQEEHGSGENLTPGIDFFN